jgi:hypothetical protein
VVNDLNNGGQLALVLALVDQDDTADFDQSPVGGLNRGLGRHFSSDSVVMLPCAVEPSEL